MPARYLQAIYKQYYLFSKSQSAQEGQAAEEMMEELEDGSGMSMGEGTSPRDNSTPNLNIRAQQIRQIQESIAASGTDDPDEIYNSKYGIKSSN